MPLALSVLLILFLAGIPLPAAEAAGVSAMTMELRRPTCFDEPISVGSIALLRSKRQCILDITTRTAIAGGFDVALGFLWTDNGPDGVTTGFSDAVVSCPGVAGALCEYTTLDIEASPATWSPDTQTFRVFATRLCGGAPCSPVDEIVLDSQAIFLRHSVMSVHCSPWPLPVNVAGTCAARVEDAGGVGVPSMPTSPSQVEWRELYPTQNGFRIPADFFIGCNLIAQAAPYRAECDHQVGPFWAAYQIAPYQVSVFWPGDASHGPSAALLEINPIDRRASLDVDCAAVLIGEPVTCDVTVTDVELGEAHEIRGNVSVRSSAPFAGLHPSFDHACELVRPPPGVPATCSFTFYPWAAGSIPLEVMLLAQTPHVSPVTSAVAPVLKRATVTAVSCGPGTLAIAEPGSCTVSVQDTTGYQTPSGIVDFTIGSVSPALSTPAVAWSPAACTLVPTGADSRATCTVGFTPASGAAFPDLREVVLDAAYQGDGLHDATSGSSLVKVHRRPTDTDVTCTPDVLIPIEGPTPVAACTATRADVAVGTSPAPAGGATSWSSGETCADPLTTCAISWVPATVGVDTRSATYSGGLDHLPSEGAASVVVHAETRVAYTGELSAVVGGALELRALAASAIPSCAASRAASVAFELDRDPVTGVAVPTALGVADLDAAGATTLAPASTSAWLPGAYTLTTKLLASSACDLSTDAALLVVGASGDSASGGGVTDGESEAAATSTGDRAGSARAEGPRLSFSAHRRGGAHEGFVLLQSSAWRIQATLTSLTRASADGTTRCSADGVADLQIALVDPETGRTTWAPATRGDDLPFSLYVEERADGSDAYALHLGRIVLPSDAPSPGGAVAMPLTSGDVGCR